MSTQIIQIGPHRWSYRRAVDAAGLYRAIGLPVPEEFNAADIGLGPNEIEVKLLSSQDETVLIDQDDTVTTSENTKGLCDETTNKTSRKS